MNKLDRYVGRIVRLNRQAFKDITQRAKRQGEVLENCFVVATINREMRKLICYGANRRIAVEVSDVALI